MSWKTSNFRLVVKSSKNYNDIIFFSVTNSQIHEESSYPALPSRLLLATLAARLSHSDVISSPTSEVYGNVTGRRWTRWLLTRSRLPRGELCAAPPHDGTAAAGQTGRRPHRQMLTHIHLHMCSTCHSTLKLFIDKLPPQVVENITRGLIF